MLFLKKFILFLTVLLFCTQAFALGLEAPSSVLVNQEMTFFEVVLTNQSAETKELSFDFFCPFDFEASGLPDQMGPDSTATVVIKLDHDSAFIGSAYSCPLEVKLDSEKITHEIKLKFAELEPVPVEAETAEGADEGITVESDENFFEENPLTGLVSLFVLTPETAEIIFDIALMFVAAVLLLAFISRFLKRIEARSIR